LFPITGRGTYFFSIADQNLTNYFHSVYFYLDPIVGCFSHIEKRLIHRFKQIEGRSRLAGTTGQGILQGLESDLHALKAEQKTRRSTPRKLQSYSEAVKESSSIRGRKRERDGSIRVRRSEVGYVNKAPRRRPFPNVDYVSQDSRERRCISQSPDQDPWA